MTCDPEWCRRADEGVGGAEKSAHETGPVRDRRELGQGFEQNTTTRRVNSLGGGYLHQIIFRASVPARPNEPRIIRD